MLDTTTVKTFTQEQLILEAHKTTAIPALITLFSFVFIIWFFIGLFGVENKRKFFLLYALAFVLCLGMLLILLFTPDLTQFVAKLFS